MSMYERLDQLAVELDIKDEEKLVCKYLDAVKGSVGRLLASRSSPPWGHAPPCGR